MPFSSPSSSTVLAVETPARRALRRLALSAPAAGVFLAFFRDEALVVDDIRETCAEVVAM